jgi:hypothetical protein
VRCPRCSTELRSREAGHEGSYRSSVDLRPRRACSGCGAAVLTRADLAAGSPPLTTPLGRTPLARQRAASKRVCPACAVPLIDLALEWEQDRAQVETCERCGLLVVGRDELERIDRMLAASAPLRAVDLTAVDLTAPLPDGSAGADERAPRVGPLARWLHRLGLR